MATKKGKKQAVQAAITAVSKKEEKKKYQRTVSIRSAAQIVNVLVWHAKKFRGNGEGRSLYTIRVDQEDKAFLDELLDRLEE